MAAFVIPLFFFVIPAGNLRLPLPFFLSFP